MLARNEWVSLKAEAERRGIAPKWLKDFCKRQEVLLRGSGNDTIVRPSDIDAAFDRLANSAADDLAELACIDATPPRFAQHVAARDLATLKATLPQRDLTKRSVVYIARASNGLLKIGTTDNIKKRLISLRTSSPLPIELLAMFEGGLVEERQCHTRFAAFRKHGERFEPAAEILEWAKQMGIRR